MNDPKSVLDILLRSFHGKQTARDVIWLVEQHNKQEARIEQLEKLLSKGTVNAATAADQR